MKHTQSIRAGDVFDGIPGYVWDKTTDGMIRFRVEVKGSFPPESEFNSYTEDEVRQRVRISFNGGGRFVCPAVRSEVISA